MKKKNDSIRDAIDESLGSVHFNAADMRRVLHATRNQEEPKRTPKPSRRRFDFVFSMALVAILVVPLCVLSLRPKPVRTPSLAPQGTMLITSAPPQSEGLPPTLAPTSTPIVTPTPSPTAEATAAIVYQTPQPTPTPIPTFMPTAIPTSPSAEMMDQPISESDAIRAVRDCFAQTCDTGVFSFYEYTVSVVYDSRDDSNTCTVTMSSIYDNGCAFTVILDAQTGAVRSTSDPVLATTPQGIREDSAEVRTWYEKNGSDMSTWPLSAQQEFSRRYEGKKIPAATPEPTQNSE